jgi:hypothetical protein
MTDVAIGVGGTREQRWFRHRRESVSFTDVVRARDHGDEDERFRRRLERFEDENGAVTDVWWSEQFDAAVAVTVRRRPRLLRVLGPYETLTLHRKTEELAREAPEFGRLLLRVDRQAIRVSNVLAGMSQRIAMSTLFALTRDVVSYLESKRLMRQPAQEEEPDHLHVPEEEIALNTYGRELREIEAYAGQAAARQAQIVYLKGMMRGLVALFLLAPALAWLFLATDVPGVDETLFIACLISGSLGALMSVLMRMNSGKFKVNHEIGREYLSNLGAARPFIGAIFALVLYFAFQGRLLDQIRLPDDPEGAFAFFMVSGFLIGFSERFAKEMLAVSEQGVGVGQSSTPSSTARQD